MKNKGRENERKEIPQLSLTACKSTSEKQTHRNASLQYITKSPIQKFTSILIPPIKCKPGTMPNPTEKFIKYNCLNTKLEIQMMSYSSGQ